MRKLSVIADNAMLSIIERFNTRTKRANSLYALKSGLMLLNLLMDVQDKNQKIVIMQDNKIIKEFSN